MRKSATHHQTPSSFLHTEKAIGSFGPRKVRRVCGSHSLALVLQLPSSLAPPSVLSRGPRGAHHWVGGGVNLQRSEISAGSFTFASTRHRFVSRRESCQCAPLSPTRPPVRPSPVGNPSSDTPSNLRLALQPQQPLRKRKQRRGIR